MAFFNDLGKRISKIADSVESKTQEGVEVGRLNGELKREKANLEKLFTALGRASYALYTGETDQSPDAEAEAVKASLERIAALEEKINIARGNRVCPNCGAAMPAGNAFCSACGSKMPEIVVPQPEPAPAPAAPEKEFCPNCGTPRKDRFCIMCGHDFEGVKPEAPAETETIEITPVANDAAKTEDKE
ncbi:MAG: zinc ribbon domain-containing protein [Clostridia bacterium]|nr:zinc ribbon domain-containing protein [Clostridia bacterium]